jgi:protein tyrosine phosphatase
MKGTKNELRKVIRGLEALIRKAERIEKGLSEEKRVVVRRRAGRPKARKRVAPKRMAVRAGKGRTATGMVFGIIKKSRRGATTTQIRNGTGFDEKKIWNVINRLKSQRKIKSARRGIYVAI